MGASLLAVAKSIYYNLTDQTYFGYNLTLYFEGFDFRGS